MLRQLEFAGPSTLKSGWAPLEPINTKLHVCRLRPPEAGHHHCEAENLETT